MDNTQQSKPDPKGKAIASLIFGVISIIGLYLMYSIVPMRFIVSFRNPESFIFPVIAIILPLIGLVLGIRGLKSTKRVFALAGIVLSVISLTIGSFLWLMALGWFLIFEPKR